ncbi:MAG: hypothetical protein K8R99_14745 [Actinomycetia bacterium]|nr:hypothetical protein [Actinomycetes bacterium]
MKAAAVTPGLSSDGQIAMSGVSDLVQRADLDGLVRMVDSLCASKDWAALADLRDRSRAAVLTGRQLWPAATLAEYRLALWAPEEWAATMLDESSGRFTIGPLTEVAAQHHTYEALARHLDGGPRAGFVAHERALRGEAIPDDAPNPLDIPFEIQRWEPEYSLATYSDEGVDAPGPALPPADQFRAAKPKATITRVDDVSVTLAVRQLLDTWTAASDGKVEVVCVEGDAATAIEALGIEQPHLAELSAADALAWMAWAGASGGAHGKRRGAAAGRFGAWWLLAALGDLLDDWPVQPGQLHVLADELSWYWWRGDRPESGWSLQLAVEDKDEGYAWAINAHDSD